MITFSAQVEGQEQFNRSFNRVSDRMTDFRWVWPAPAKAIRRFARAQILSEGKAGASGQYPKLSPKTVEQKRRKGYPAAILQRTGDLLKSVATKTGPGSIERMDERSLEVGTALPYGKYHQTGTGRMPARPIYSLSEAQKIELMKEIQRALLREARAAGFLVN